MFIRFITVSTILLMLLTLSFARDQREDARIAALIQAVESLQGTRFIRNGTEYDCKAAADHLRLKLRRAGDRVKTADDFIEDCASRSSVSGAKYRLRFPDGKETDAEVFFHKKLKEIDHASN
jgi:membrane-bound inhibitor of C-type lysozyme